MNLVMISICEKTRLQQLRKAKHLILTLILYIFRIYFLTKPHTYLYHTLCKSKDFLTYCFEPRHIFQKMCLFGKVNFVILF